MAARKKSPNKKKPAAAAEQTESPPPPFEKALGELEQIVDRLERGEVPLDESLKLYERGVRAFRLCRKILDRAEKRIQVLVRDTDGMLSVRDIDDEDAAARAGSEVADAAGGDLFAKTDEGDPEA